MILRIRIDDRLLHGQVAYSWKSALSYDAIVIASNAAANDEMRKATIKMCCPDGVKFATRSIEEAAKLLKNPKLEKMRVFFICGNVKDAYELAHLLDEKPLINVGGMQMEEHKVFFSKAVYVSKEDIEYLDLFQKEGYSIEVQEVPSTSVHEYQPLRNKVSFDN